MKTNTKNTTNHGFTLIEMVGVLAVIAILAALLVPKIFAAINDSRISSAVSGVNACKTATMTYFGKTAAFPLTTTTDAASILATRFDQVLVDEKLMDQLLSCKIAETASSARVTPITAAADAAAVAGDGTCFSLDGVTPITGVKVVYIKLEGVTASDAKELSRRSTGKTLYILDEPTTGLHPADIQHLLRVLGRLVDGGNTVVVIEHTLDIIAEADWLLDLGPEGGSGGGRLVIEGSPEQVVAARKRSHTGEVLHEFLTRT